MGEIKSLLVLSQSPFHTWSSVQWSCTAEFVVSHIFP